MLNKIIMAAATLTMLSAAPAIADDDDRRWRGDRYERGYDRYDRRDDRAYHRDARKYYKQRAKASRKAYKAGYRDARRDRRFYAGGRHYDRYQPVYYRRAGDYRGGWYGRNGRYYDSYERCRSNGGINTGTVIGGVLGGVLGNEVAGRGDKTVGTILGAAVGAVIGHEIDDNGSKRRYCY